MRLAHIALVVVVVVVALVSALLVTRSVLQWREARNLAIATPDGVDESGFIDIGGVAQWVQMRGLHRANPVIIVVHGGPGFAMSPLTRVFRPWESEFTVVQWDQRDAGRTFSRNGPQPISIDRIARDGLEVAEHVQRKLPGARVILLGHSWGSAVGLEMIQRRPDLFAAYVGAGQMSSKAEQETLSYERVFERLRAAGVRDGVDELRRLGPPPYKDLAELLVQRKWLATVDTPAEQHLFQRMAPLLLVAPQMSLKQTHDYLAAPKVAQAGSFNEVAQFDARRIGGRFSVPIFIFQGDRDLYTPGEPTERYLSEVEAPLKDIAVLPGGGHDALLTMPDAFLRELRNRVRPRVLADGISGS